MKAVKLASCCPPPLADGQLELPTRRLRVELKDDFTKDKNNELSMEHVRRHWKQRPFKYDAIVLDDRLDPSALDPEKEWEVDSVSSRR